MSGAPDRPLGSPPDSAPKKGEYVLRTLLVSDLVGSTAIVRSIGDAHAASLFRRHDRRARDLLLAHHGIEIDKTDGFLLLFERPLDAVLYALAYHHTLTKLSSELEISLVARIGIHLGELHVIHSSAEDVARGAKPVNVEGLAKPMTARVMSVALGRQTLLTRSAFELARRASVGEDWARNLCWVNHGRYLLKGVDEPVELFEVGREHESPLIPPADSEKVIRLVGEPTAVERMKSLLEAPGVRSTADSLLALVTGDAAGRLLHAAAEAQVVRFFGETIEQVIALGQKETVTTAMVRAWAACAELTLDRIRVLCDFDPDELADDQEFVAYTHAMTRLIDDQAAGNELLRGLILKDANAPDASVLQARWEQTDGPELPTGFRWSSVADAFHKRMKKGRVLTPDLHDRLDTDNLAAILTRFTELKPEGDEDLYTQQMRDRYRVLELDTMRPPGADALQIPLITVFEPPMVREDPPPLQLPEALQRRLLEAGVTQEDSAWQLEQAQKSYTTRRPEPVMEVVTRAANRHLVLLGEPGSGKSTIARYLLLATIDSLPDHTSSPPSEQTISLAGHLPLLVELGDYANVSIEGRCGSFLSYWNYLGVNRGYHLNDGWLDRRLHDQPSLVLFDGADEVSDARQQEHILRDIAALAESYPQARIVVTSQALGYQSAVLRDAGFHHYAIEDLNNRQITSFLERWFKHFQEVAEQPHDHLLNALARSQSIRVMAGNPMLLTMMALCSSQQPEQPQEHWAFHNRTFEALCHSWDLNRHLEEVGFSKYFSLEDKEELLRCIALAMETEEWGLAANLIRQEHLESLLEAFLSEQFGTTGTESKRLGSLLISRLRRCRSLLCLRGPRLLGFLHRSLLEYCYASDQIKRLREQPDYPVETLCEEVFAAHWQEPEWRGILRLVSSLAGDQNLAILAGYLISSAYPNWRSQIDDKPPVNLVVAIQCLAEAINPATLEQQALLLVQTIAEVVECPERWKGARLASFFEQDLLPAARSFVLPSAAKEWLEGHFADVLGRIRSHYMLAPFARLAAIWLSSSQTILQTLYSSSVNDSNHSIRCAAIEALAEGWPDAQKVRSLISQRACEDEHHEVQISALHALTRTWRDDTEIFSVISQRAVNDSHYDVRRAAVETMAEGWPGLPEAHAILDQLAVSDHSISVRSAALEGLTHGWPGDSAVQSLLYRLAGEDEHHEIRVKSLHLLGRDWADDRQARAFIRQRALEDEHQDARRAGMEALIRGTLSRQALVLLSNDLDGQAPFLDPREPVPPMHIAQGARQLRIEESNARDLLAACQSVLGWNPLRGAGEIQT
jgi:class 3 adenylate cyclase/energy-coupling factor transporter ATP-binding protein EcfA2